MRQQILIEYHAFWVVRISVHSREFSSESLSGLANASSCTWMMGQQQFGLHFFAVNLTNQNLQAHTIYSIYLVDGHQKSCEHRLE